MDPLAPTEQATARRSGGAMLDAVIDRRPEARRIGEIILNAIAARRRTVVLHGGPGSGITRLMTQWVIPDLRARSRGRFAVWYGSCSPDFPDRFEGVAGRKTFNDVIATPSVVVVDRFTAVFDLPRDERRAVLDRMFEKLEAGDAGAVAVLITDSRQLTSVYALSSYDPDITDAVFRVAPVGIEDGLRHLSAVHPESAVTYSEDVQRALGEDAADLQEQGWPVTIDLIKLIDARFRRLRTGPAERSVERADYEGVGGLEGILRSHLEEQLDRLPAEEECSEEIARAILDDIAEARGEIAAPDFGEIPPRLGVAPAQVAAVHARLTGPEGMVRRLDDGPHRLVPPQLAAIIRDDLTRRARYVDRIHRLVDEAERSWSQVGNLLPRERFLEVHRARTQLVLGREQLRFLLQAALHLEDAESSGASEYWLHRVKDPVDGVDILLAALFDQHRHVRLQAARLLRHFPAPEVRERLRVLALTDPDPEVRDQAVTSLQPMSDAASLELFVSEARNPTSPHRLAAVDALRISSTEDVVRLLQELVNDPATDWPVRERAIKVLATIGTRPSVDALLAIALHDQDEEDRTAATAALGKTTSDELNQHVLRSVGPPSPLLRIWLTRVLLAVLTCAAGLSFFFGGMVGSVRVLAVLWVGSLVVLIPTTRRLLLSLRDGRTERTSARGMLGIALFALNTVSLFFLVHGLAHLLIGRWRRALLLIGLEVVGVVFAIGVVAIANSVPGLAWVGMFYVAVGFLFFFGSYVYDVVIVLFETVVLTDTRRLAARRAAVYREVIGNPAAARLLFEALRSPDRDNVRWATTLLRRFATSLNTRQLIDLLVAREPTSMPIVVKALRRSKVDDTVRRLEQLWRTADQELRRWIADVLCRRPTQRSLEALDAVRQQLSRRKKLRLTAARWYFRLTMWPLAVWVLVVLGVPTAFVLGYHGFKVFKNPAWSQIVSLNLRGTSENKMVTAVEILSEHYPEAAAGILVNQFRERKHAWRVHAALARGLVTIHYSGSVARLWDERAREQLPVIHEQLLAQADGFYDRLAQSRSSTSSFFAISDSAVAVQALEVLRTMADARDSAFGAKGVALLTRFVLDSSSVSAYVPPHEALKALGSVSYERALPALDTLLTEREGGPLGRVIRQQIESVIDRTYSRLRAGEPSVDGERLLAALTSLRNQPAPGLIRDVQRLVREAEAAGCDRNKDGRCDEVDHALELIESNPSTEYGYTVLLDHFVTQERYATAESVLTTLRDRYPTSVWARKTLTTLYHEYLSDSDTTWSDTLAFRRSFEEMQALRNLAAYGTLREDTYQDYLRVEADFAEIALSARRYDELEIVAEHLLQVTDRPVYRLNLTLFLYIARVMQGDADSAEAALDRLEQVVQSLDADYYNNWIYPGTVLFIKRSGLPDELKSVVIRLCNEGYWYNRKEADKVIGDNRRELRLLRLQ